MGDIIARESVQVSADAQRLGADLAQGSKHVDRFAANTNKALGGLKAGDFAKIGLVAGGGEVLKNLVAGNAQLENMLNLTRTIGLGWAAGGVIGAGIGVAVAGLSEAATLAEKVAARQELGLGAGLGFATKRIGQFFGGESPEAAMNKSLLARSEAPGLERANAVAKAMSNQIDEMVAKLEKSPKEVFIAQALQGVAVRGEEARQALQSIEKQWGVIQELSGKGGLKKFNDDLQKQLDTWGMTAAQIAAYEAKLNGVAPAVIAAGEASAKLKIAEIDWRKQGDEMEKWSNDLQKQADTLGMTSDQIRLYELRKAGANKAPADRGGLVDVAQLQRLEQYNALVAQVAQNARVKDIAAETAKRNADALQAQAQLATEAKAVWESTQTPMERFNATAERLQEMFRAGEIDAIRYNRALTEAGKGLDRLSEKTGPNTGLRAGSSEALAATFAAQRDRSRLGGADPGQAAILEAQKKGNAIAEEVKKAAQEQLRAIKDLAGDIFG